MQHLGVLEEAGLVLARRDGRSRFNHFNPIPIRQLYERWMRSHSSIAAETALHLKRYAETTNEVALQVDQAQYRHIQIELELHIKAPREKVFRALTEEFGNWWPHRYKPDSACFCDPVVGGRIGERFSNGGGAIYGEIVYLDPPFKYVSSGSSSLNRGLHGYTVETLEEHEEGTLLKRSSHLWGSVTDDVEKMYRDGSRMLLEQALRDYCEKGIGYEVPKEEGQ